MLLESFIHNSGMRESIGGILLKLVISLWSGQYKVPSEHELICQSHQWRFPDLHPHLVSISGGYRGANTKG